MACKKSQDKLKKTYVFLSEFINKNKYPPSVREICAELGFKSTASAQYYLDKLTELGYIKRSALKNRTIEIVASETEQQSPAKYDADEGCNDNKVVSLPLLGNVAAGEPLLAAVNVDDTLSLPTDLFSVGAGSFVLRVKGESMIDAGILNEDYVVITQQNTADDGEIVVAQIDNEEVTLKRFFRMRDCVRLHPENATMQDIIIDSSHTFKILGVMRGLMRTYARV